MSCEIRSNLPHLMELTRDCLGHHIALALSLVASMPQASAPRLTERAHHSRGVPAEDLGNLGQLFSADFGFLPRQP